MDIVETIKIVLEGIAYIVFGASIIAAITPTKKDDEILKAVKKALNIAAINVKHAKPKDD